MRSGYVVDDPRVGARWMVERTRAAYEARLDALFVGDHHATPIAYYQNSPILGRLLADWRGALVGALYLVPLWNPVLVAEQVGTLASLTDSRFVLQCAIGGGDQQFAAMGASLARRVPDFEAGLMRIRALLAGDPDPVSGARIGLVPGDAVDVWIGGHVPAAIGRAARLGDAWYADPRSDLGTLRRDVEIYRERCAAAGSHPATIAVRRDVHVAGTTEEAWSVARPVIDAGYRGMDADVPIVGSAGEVAARFRELGDMGFTDVVIRHLADDQTAVLDSFAQLAAVREMLD